MALITGFMYRSDRAVSYKTRVDCGWTFERNEGLLYASDGTTSQVLQIDEQHAAELMGIIAQVFPTLYLPQASRPDEEH